MPPTSGAALLDVNLLVALFDAEHVHHEPAHAWFERNRARWATCAITENGFVRVVSNPRYPGRGTTAADAARRLGRLCETEGHRFFSDLVSIRDRGLFRYRQLGGYRRVTDLWLLGLAVRQGGRLATFDRRIPLEGVAGAVAGSLELIEP